jgi:hypothetical protein
MQFSIGNGWSRWLFFSVLLTVPVIRVLLDNSYGFLHLEIAVLLLLIGGASAVMATVTRHAVLFHVVAALTVVLLSVNALVHLLPPVAGTKAGLVLMLPVAVSCGIVVLKSNFYRLAIVFTIASLGGDVVKGGLAARPATDIGTKTKPQIVVHLLLDEMSGLAAFPEDCRHCQVARTDMERVLRRGNFQIYPYAFSNYTSTRDSIPSILNGRLLDRCAEYVQKDAKEAVLSQNAYFDRFHEQEYAIRIYQSDYIHYSPPRHLSAKAETYPAVGTLATLHRTNLAWNDRLHVILSRYVYLDSIWRLLWSSFASEPDSLRSSNLGPLAVADIWPTRIVSDMREAGRKTLFFVHLLTPHFPYVFNRDGSVKRPREWAYPKVFKPSEAAGYRRAYEEYGEQVQAVARQIESFLEGMRAAGLYDSATVIIHGDHGSRIRLITAEDAAQKDAGKSDCMDVSLYRYCSQPASRDLLDQFGTLFAVKHPGAAYATMVGEKASVMQLLWQSLFPDQAQPSESARNSIYLFDLTGQPRGIPGTQLWNRKNLTQQAVK